MDRFMWPGGSEPRPTTNQNYPRMYGHNLCPFVARARYVFACKEVPYQEVFVDLNEKAQWHLEFNGGMVPVLEAPTGELIPESGIQVQYALEAAPRSQGIDLIPEDPITAATMRFKIAEHDKNVLRKLFTMGLARFGNSEANDVFCAEALPYMESLCPEVGSDKWLMGGDEITLMDV